MAMTVMGAEMTANVGSWRKEQRRAGSILALGAAVLLTLIGVGTWFFVKDKAAILYWVLVGLLALVLVFVLMILVLGVRADRKRHAHHAGPAAPESVVAAEPEPQRGPPTVTLRCGDCSTVFDVTDTGERPLYHACPGCGAEGILRAPPAAPSAPSPVAHASPPPAETVSQWAPPAQAAFPSQEERAPEPPPAAPMPRRLKLRCGGCKEVFVIEDSGERPLRRPCPHCARMGEIR